MEGTSSMVGDSPERMSPRQIPVEPFPELCHSKPFFINFDYTLIKKAIQAARDADAFSLPAGAAWKQGAVLWGVLWGRTKLTP